MTCFEPSRIAGLARLQRFASSSGRHYYKNRNYDHGPDDRSNVSQLSPYLRHRMIAEWEVIHTANQECGATAQKFIDEVLWRTYWKGWLEQHPQVWQAYCQDIETLTAGLNQRDKLANRYRLAVTGSTHIEPFNEWANELVTSGYLHNHARMWFASIWIFTLGLPWQLGADFFLRHLLDGDPASNTLSWRWVAGLHTRGKTYKAMQHNIERYARQRFSDSALATLTSLSDDAPACREPLPTKPGKLNLPADGEPPENCGLLIVEDDLFAELTLNVSAIACIKNESTLTLPTADAVLKFREHAMDDALDRCRARWPSAQVEPSALTSASIVSWAKDQGVRDLVIPYVPQGHSRPSTDALTERLRLEGITVHQWLHPYDRSLWPFAQSGYFRFRDRARAAIASLIQPPSLPPLAKTG